jgi:glutathione S-transferase
MARELHGHGMRRHSQEDIHTLGCRDIAALADFLADKPYLMGMQPCSLDAVAYGFLANLLWVPLDSALKQRAQKTPQLERYCQRMRDRYYAQ